MMHLGGWTRLWIILTLMYGAVVALVAYQTRPQIYDLRLRWIQDVSEEIAAAISRVEKTDVSSDEVRKNMFGEKDPLVVVGELEEMAASPTENQRIFSPAIANLNQRHRVLVDGFPALRRDHVLLALAWWMGPSVALYVLAWSVAWVVAGFRRHEA